MMRVLVFRPGEGVGREAGFSTSAAKAPPSVEMTDSLKSLALALVCASGSASATMVESS